jgi:hypothetical protein
MDVFRRVYQQFHLKSAQELFAVEFRRRKAAVGEANPIEKLQAGAGVPGGAAEIALGMIESWR